VDRAVEDDETTTVRVVERTPEEIMLRNESLVDRAIRAVIGVIAAVVAFSVGAGSGLGIVLLLVAVILLVTAAVGFCPLYRVFGNLSTVRKN
jgi:type IV secretory pathway TrbD component